MKKKATSPHSLTDWERVDRMRDEDIDFSDLPEIPPERFARALVRKGLKPVARKSQITLRIDADVLEWFRAKGSGYQSQMNAILRAYKEAHEKA
ncbi:MAG TPA: BrnA antitoxin family protein [Thermoanaerobaculia bacterium]|nr:BrnA antitoxin family protein [Thermoanaerobaculia bacterium]